MSKVCEVCGKHPVAGRSISHSHRVTNRKFRPNIQRVYVVVDGHRRKMNVCSTCLKSGKVARSHRTYQRRPPLRRAPFCTHWGQAYMSENTRVSLSPMSGAMHW